MQARDSVPLLYSFCLLRPPCLQFAGPLLSTARCNAGTRLCPLALFLLSPAASLPAVCRVFPGRRELQCRHEMPTLALFTAYSLPMALLSTASHCGPESQSAASGSPSCSSCCIPAYSLPTDLLSAASRHTECESARDSLPVLPCLQCAHGSSKVARNRRTGPRISPYCIPCMPACSVPTLFRVPMPSCRPISQAQAGELVHPRFFPAVPTGQEEGRGQVNPRFHEC